MANADSSWATLVPQPGGASLQTKYETTTNTPTRGHRPHESGSMNADVIRTI